MNKGTLLRITDCGGSAQKKTTQDFLFACCCDFGKHPVIQ
jgi:hypothetical protein